VNRLKDFGDGPSFTPPLRFAEVATHHGRRLRVSVSDPDPLDLIERDLVAAPVIEAGRPR
jgi:hypothetical protein